MSILPNDNMSSQAYEKKPHKSKCYRIFFKTYKPQPSIKTAIVVLSILGIIFIVIGSILVVYGMEIKEFRQDFEPCGEESVDVAVKVTEKMKKPVYIYYQANEFYQNHRKYSKSISYKQLKGEKITKDEARIQCDMAYEGDDFNRARKINPPYKSNQVAYPCGITSKSFLDIKIDAEYTDSNGISYSIKDDDITWAFDRNERFKSISDVKYWTNVEDGNI